MLSIHSPIIMLVNPPIILPYVPPTSAKLVATLVPTLTAPFNNDLVSSPMAV